MIQKLKAPFPYFGGKSTIADRVWKLLGDPRNYVEPFVGSGAMLLRRPNSGDVETINDANHYVANFWRAVKHDPDSVAIYADNPVSEIDLHSRHLYLTRGIAYQSFSEQMKQDPEFFDAKFAGWWCWGQCCWIGGGWCTDQAMKIDGTPKNQMPECKSNKGCLQGPSEKIPMGSHGNSAYGAGVNAKPSEQLPHLSGDSGATGRGVAASSGHNKRRPNLSNNKGTNNWVQKPASSTRGVAEGRPQLGDAFDIGRGVNGNKHAGTCERRIEWLKGWFNSLADRFRLVRTCYGNWNRICDSRTTMTRLGTTGAFLDPPYAKNVERTNQWRLFLEGKRKTEPEQKATSSNRAAVLYANDHSQDIDKMVAEVNLWCQRWGSNPDVRIVLCGYEGEHDNLVSEHGWTVDAWKAHGGYANRNSENDNKHRERLWVSPHCLSGSEQKELF